MSGKINLILGHHAHVPHGATEHEFENAYENILKPFVSNLCKYPKIQVALHYSGVLLHWVERTHWELFMLIEDLVSRKQVEILGGGFYEPMLPLIPLQDRIGQIELFTTYLRKQFGKRPLGCWIPALAWEQNLVSPLASCGMTYTFLGERQFAEAGMGGENLLRPCLCEEQGKLVAVFPLCQRLEAALSEKNISTILAEENEKQTGGEEAIVSIFPEKLRADPVESPDYTWNRFFEELSLSEPFAETVMPGKILKNMQVMKKACFPDSIGKTGVDVRSTPRRFLIEHPEADGIYSKMVFTGLLINQLKGDKSRKQSAREELWKSQGCGLFHTLDKQGLYRHTLRNAAYSALLGAERVTRDKGNFAPSLIPYDFNLDGTNEYLFQDTRINCYVQSLGGGIFELDYLPKVWNYLNTCDGRLAFADRLLPAGIKPEELTCGPVAGGRICRNERYELTALDKVRRKMSFRLNESSDAPFGSIVIEKSFSLKKDLITVSYSLCNRHAEQKAFLFAPEIDLSFPNEGDTFTRFFVTKEGSKDAPLSESLLRGAESLKLQDLKNEVQIGFSSTQVFDGRIVPVRIGRLDDDCQYQATCVMPLFALSLESGGKWAVEFALHFSH